MEQKQINIVEVGPRDGFQNLKEFIPTDKKLQIIDDIITAGIKHIEITSFVSPKAIPQMQDAATVAEKCLEKYPALDLFALAPNLYGAKAANVAGLKRIVYVISLSKSHNKANINRTHEQSFEELDNILQTLPELNVSIDVATAFGCPFEGIPEDDRLLEFLRVIYDKGLRSICLCDTVGLADPAQVRRVLTKVQEEFPKFELEVHIHDTRGMGAVNTLAAIECGVTNVQSTLGGLGGCPFAPGASGNYATEDLAFMLERMGYDTGVNFEKLLIAAKSLNKDISGNYSGHQIHVTTNCNL